MIASVFFFIIALVAFFKAKQTWSWFVFYLFLFESISVLSFVYLHTNVAIAIQVFGMFCGVGLYALVVRSFIVKKNIEVEPHKEEHA